VILYRYLLWSHRSSGRLQAGSCSWQVVHDTIQLDIELVTQFSNSPNRYSFAWRLIEYETSVEWKFILAGWVVAANFPFQTLLPRTSCLWFS
jgi:hypothetical protein